MQGCLKRAAIRKETCYVIEFGLEQLQELYAYTRAEATQSTHLLSKCKHAQASLDVDVADVEN